MLMKTQNLTKTYGEKTVVNQLNLEIPKGSLVAYLGTNGAGKSTTIKMLTGLLAPTSGKVIRASDLKIGIVFQDSVLDEELTVRANLKNRAGLYQHIDKTWLNELVELTGLSGFLGQKYGTLSGGQRRRVDITRALLNKPDLLFLDEPTTGLDIQTRQMIWQLLYRLKKEQGLTIFLTTHYLEEAENAEVTYVIDHGKILAQGTAFDLVKEYAKSQLLLKVADPTSLTALPFPLKETEAGYLIEGVSSQEVIGLLGKYREAIADCEFKQGTINEAFIAITGKEIS
ncbi:MAG: ABC transporter ATP-binding protein [Streptococcus orisratti]|uniref:ABC transporter ATP-binding protein n=1 Tax=Streptococcus orisratti TaxID=114652 RepID=UPI002356D6FF|nr:ABC transporter ATP-binding protein [Streptococcus orisratti]MCI7677336.1 ABC transporter ATP-binding protein [Streptococcus orisratti]